MSGSNGHRSERHEALATRMVADATPVRRLWPTWVRFTLWASLGAGLFALVATTSCRPDLSQQLRVPSFVLHLVLLFAAAAYAGALAIRAAVPGDEPGTVALSVACILSAAAVLCAFAAPEEPAATGAEFVHRGLICTMWTAVFAFPPWAAVMIALHRGAPLAMAGAAACAGAAAVLLAAGILRTACPIEDRWHIFTWHLAPVCIAAALSTILASEWLRRWRMRASPVLPRP